MWLVNNELENVWGEDTMADLKYRPSIFVAVWGPNWCCVPPNLLCNGTPCSWLVYRALLNNVWKCMSVPPYVYIRTAWRFRKNKNIESKSHFSWQPACLSVCLSWCRAPFWAHDQLLVDLWRLWSRRHGAHSLRGEWVCPLRKEVFTLYLPLYGSRKK
jgi:hypothetical protein